MLAFCLYGGLLCLVLVIRLPGSRLTEKAYEPIRITLLPPVFGETVRAETVLEDENEQPLKRATSLLPAQPAENTLPLAASTAAVLPNPDTVPESGYATGPAMAETSGYGAMQGRQTFRSGNSAAAEEKSLFLSWLDAELRDRLAYPDRARRRNIEGTVTVRLSVTADGSRCEAVISAGSGSALLDRAAVDLVRSLFPAAVSPGKDFTESIQIEYLLNQD